MSRLKSGTGHCTRTFYDKWAWLVPESGKVYF